MPRLVPLPPLFRDPIPSLPSSTSLFLPRRQLHVSPCHLATPLPITAAGPPPAAPQPAANSLGQRLERRQRQAELLKKGQELRLANNATPGSAPSKPVKPGQALKRRFWKEVSVQQDSESNHTIHLDTRPVRDPTTKTTLPIPASKPHLASAIALEWDLLVSAAQALKTHHIPLTSLAARAREIDLDDQQRIESRLSARLSGSDAVGSNGGGRGGTVREEIVQVMMRYLDTDTLLCWAPLKSGPGEASGLENRTDNISARSETSKHSDSDRRNQSLRERQIRTAQPIIAYLTTYIWPGVSIKPVLEDAGSIIPAAQAPATRDVIRGWITGLRAWELAGLERAVLASKSLCVGARLAVEWSEEFEGVRREEVEGRGEEEEGVGKRFGVEEAARACSLEVEWQTGMWGEVEDTHDVEKEDLRRQLGSVVLVVSGTGRRGDTSEE